MFGWEFPPHSVGGLGNVTYHLTNALSDLNTEISLVLPVCAKSPKMKIISAEVSVTGVEAILMPYMTEKSYLETLQKRLSQDIVRYGLDGGIILINTLGVAKKGGGVYGGDLFRELELFALKCIPIAKTEKFDIIHCHDWLTFMAGIAAKEVSGKPLVLHVHTTEIDRSCGGKNQRAYDVEYEAFHKADCIIAVSEYTKGIIVKHYGIDPQKVEVVHNAINFNGRRPDKILKSKKIILYFGRLSLHKGPDYFIKAAKRVLEFEKNAVFIVAGGGEMMPELISLACSMGLGDNILFTGKLTDEEVEEMYRTADLYVMPSISEPFGITALEAASHGTPVIISKNSGAKEILHHCLPVDFWDTEEMANKIISLLKYPQAAQEISENAYRVLENISWKNRAKETLNIYNKLTG
jgi:glycosyltransferase involved in cell wall biosynthesis